MFIREKELSNANLLESGHIKRGKASLPVNVRRSKTSLVKFPNIHMPQLYNTSPFFVQYRFFVLIAVGVLIWSSF